MRYLLILFAVIAQGQTFVYRDGYPQQHCRTLPFAEFHGQPVACDIVPLPAIPQAGESYVDANFGSLVTVVSPTGIVTAYSSPTASNGRYVAGTGYGPGGNQQPNGMLSLFDLSGRTIRSNSGANQEWGMWFSTYTFLNCMDAQDSYWQIRRTASEYSIVEKCVSNNSERKVLDYLAIGLTQRAKTGSTADPSKDGWLAFFDDSVREICLAPLDASGRYWCVGYDDIPFDGSDGSQTIDFVAISKGTDPNGNRFVHAQTSGAVFKFNGTSLTYFTRSPESPSAAKFTPTRGNGDGVCARSEMCVAWNHSAWVELPDGSQAIFAKYETERPYASWLGLWNMRDAPRLPMEAPVLQVRAHGSRGGGATPSHFGCSPVRPVCVVSGEGPASSDPQPPGIAEPYASQIMVFDFAANPVKVIPVAMHHSVRWGRCYFCLPRASISPSGEYVAWTDNLGTNPEERRILVASTGLGSAIPTPPPAPPPDPEPPPPQPPSDVELRLEQLESRLEQFIAEIRAVLLALKAAIP